MKRPPKPRIARKRLKWRWNQRHGVWEPLHRVTQTVNGKRRETAVVLDWQGDPQELDRLYWQCETNQHERQQAPARYTWEELISRWRADPRVQGKIAESTKKSYMRPMEAILEKNAKKDVRKTTRQAVRSAHDKLAPTPRQADKYLQTISLLWNYALHKLDWPLGPNPAKGIDHYGTQREFLPWPDWMVAKLADAPEKVRTAAELILGTGQRPSAAIGMRWDAFDGEWMSVLDEKQGEPFPAYCPADLRAYLSGTPKRGAHVLAKNLTEPLTYDAIASAFSKWRRDLGPRAKPYSLHGLRKLAIVRLAEAGCSDAEIQAVTNQSPQTVAYYRKKASRKRLSRTAQERRT